MANSCHWANFQFYKWPKIEEIIYRSCHTALSRIFAQNSMQIYKQQFILRLGREQHDQMLELKSYPNVSKSCLNNIHSSFYIKWSFSKWTTSHQSFLATFVSTFVDMNGQKLPNLVTLVRSKAWKCQNTVITKQNTLHSVFISPTDHRLEQESDPGLVPELPSTTKEIFASRKRKSTRQCISCGW